VPSVARTPAATGTVDSAFSCTDGAGGTGIASCVDQNGHPSGSAIDTATTGPHMLTVTAASSDGLDGTASVSYTVIGPPAASIAAPASGASYVLNQAVASGFTCTEGA
jgi:hypothetical protein